MALLSFFFLVSDIVTEGCRRGQGLYVTAGLRREALVMDREPLCVLEEVVRAPGVGERGDWFNSPPVLIEDPLRCNTGWFVCDLWHAYITWEFI